MSIADDIAAAQRALQGRPEPIAYLVLDHDVAPGDHVEGRDGRDRRYVRCSPSVMDAARHVKYGGLAVAAVRLADGILSVPFGFPVYRREDLPEGWPR
jgi:hypothetical protein